MSADAARQPISWFPMSFFRLKKEEKTELNDIVQRWAHTTTLATIWHEVLMDAKLSLNSVPKLYFDSEGRTFLYLRVSQKPQYVVALPLIATLVKCREPSSVYNRIYLSAKFKYIIGTIGQQDLHVSRD